MTSGYSVCPHDCPDTCGWQVDVEDGKVIRIKGDPAHPVTQGVICEKARYYAGRVYSEDRVLYPMRRSGPKGSGNFVRISWSEALNEIVERWQVLIKEHGAEAILPYSYAGTEGVINKASMDRRFFHRLGATSLERTICSAAGSAGYNLVYGQSKGVKPSESLYSKLLIFWGINALETNIHQALLADQARKQGAKLIVIDVHRNKTARWADDFFHILPGSDGALALGLAHIILRDGLAAEEWVAKHTLGFDHFAREAKNYPPERVAGLTGLSVDRVEELAHLYAKTRASLIRVGNGLQHHDNGGMSTWAIACLPLLTGAWAYRGGGLIKFNSGYFPIDKTQLERPDLLKGTPRVVNMNRLGRALTELEPPVYSLYVYNSNPAVVAPEQELVKQGLAREDLFTVVHEQLWTDTARWADIVLPATTHLEHADLYISYWHCVLQWADPLISRQGESKPNIEVFQELAHLFEFTEPCFADSTEELARQALSAPYFQENGITLARLQQEHFIELPDIPEVPFAKGNFPTRSGRAQLAAGLSDNLSVGTSEEPAGAEVVSVPKHLPLIEGPETASQLYPLTLISPPNHSFLNSTFANIPKLRKQAGEPVLDMHPLDAGPRGLHDGDLVEVFNSRGRVELRLRVTDAVLPRVVVSTGVWWRRDCRQGNSINCLTPSRLSDLGRGATFFSNLVEVRRMN